MKTINRLTELERERLAAASRKVRPSAPQRIEMARLKAALRAQKRRYVRAPNRVCFYIE
jgi:hypothetical protein